MTYLNGFPPWKKYLDLLIGLVIVGVSLWLVIRDMEDGTISATTGIVALIMGIGGGVFISVSRVREFVKLIKEGREHTH